MPWPLVHKLQAINHDLPSCCCLKLMSVSILLHAKCFVYNVCTETASCLYACCALKRIQCLLHKPSWQAANSFLWLCPNYTVEGKPDRVPYGRKMMTENCFKHKVEEHTHAKTALLVAMNAWLLSPILALGCDIKTLLSRWSSVHLLWLPSQ